MEKRIETIASFHKVIKEMTDFSVNSTMPDHDPSILQCLSQLRHISWVFSYCTRDMTTWNTLSAAQISGLTVFTKCSKNTVHGHSIHADSSATDGENVSTAYKVFYARTVVLMHWLVRTAKPSRLTSRRVQVTNSIATPAITMCCTYSNNMHTAIIKRQ